MLLAEREFSAIFGRSLGFYDNDYFPGGSRLLTRRSMPRALHIASRSVSRWDDVAFLSVTIGTTPARAIYNEVESATA